MLHNSRNSKSYFDKYTIEKEILLEDKIENTINQEIQKLQIFKTNRLDKIILLRTKTLKTKIFKKSKGF